MQTNWTTIRVTEERQKMIIREAEQYRLWSEAESAEVKAIRQKRVSRYRPLLAKVGKQLVAIGYALQERYADLADTTEMKPMKLVTENRSR